MAPYFPIQAVICTHLGVSVFLLRGLRNGVITGISPQTVVVFAVNAFLLVLQKVYWKIVNRLYGLPFEFTSLWVFELLADGADALVLCACVYALRNSKRGSDQMKEHAQDDFGKKEARYLWSMLGGQRAPPAYLYWGVVYLLSFIMSFFAAWASTSFSLVELYDWASSRPTAMMAILINFMRGLSWLPQLHVSRKVGVVSPGLALWIAMLGAIDLIELLRDSTVFTKYIHGVCYIVADVISLLLISDFMWIFFKSRLQGKTVVEIPMVYQV